MGQGRGSFDPLKMADDNVWTLEMADDNLWTLEMADDNVWTPEMADDNYEGSMITSELWKWPLKTTESLTFQMSVSKISMKTIFD